MTDPDELTVLTVFGRIFEIVGGGLLVLGVYEMGLPARDAGSGIAAMTLACAAFAILLFGALLALSQRDRRTPWLVGIPLVLSALLGLRASLHEARYHEARDYQQWVGRPYPELEQRIGESELVLFWDPVHELDAGLRRRPPNRREVEDRFDADRRGAPIFRYSGMDVMVGYDGKIERIVATWRL